MLLLNVAVLLVLTLVANGMVDAWGDWSDWNDLEECKVLCGGGYKLQKKTRVCPEDETCEGESVIYTNGTCNTQECGDLCPLGEITFIPHPINPSRFYQCANGRAWLHKCPAGGLIWNQTLHFCVWA